MICYIHMIINNVNFPHSSLRMKGTCNMINKKLLQIFSTICILVWMTAGCDQKRTESSPTFDASTEAPVIESSETEADTTGTWNIFIHTMPVYGSDITEHRSAVIGEAEVTFVFPQKLFATADAWNRMTTISLFCAADKNSEDDTLFNQYYWDSAGVYSLHDKETISETDQTNRYHYETIKYRHGMDDDYLSIYGEEADAAMREKRSYQYLLKIDYSVYAVLTFAPDDTIAVMENEDAVFDTIAARLEVNYTLDPNACGNQLYQWMTDWTNAGDTAYLQRYAGTDLFTEEEITDRANRLSDALHAESWIPCENPDFHENPDDGICLYADHFTLNIGKTEPYVRLSCNGFEAVYRVPTVQQKTVACITAWDEEFHARYDAKYAQMLAFLPEEAEELLYVGDLHHGYATLLSYRTRNGEPCLWYSPDLGETFQRVNIIIPSEYPYDRAEVQYGYSTILSGGEYTIYLTLYSGDTVTYLETYGWIDMFYQDMEHASGWELIPAYMLHSCGDFENNVPDLHFPNTNCPRTIDDLSEWDVLKIEEICPQPNTARLYYQYIQAFLEHDTKMLEELCGVPSGVYDDYQNMQIDAWRAYPENGQLYFTFRSKDTTSQAFASERYFYTYCLTYDPEIGVILKDPTDVRDTPHTEKESAVLALGDLMFDFPAEDMDTNCRRTCTDYLLHQLQQSDAGTVSLEMLQNAAQKTFGLETFTPDNAFLQDGGYLCTETHPQTVYAAYLYESKEGFHTSSVEIHFYADPSHTLESDVFRFTIAENEDGSYRFTEKEVLKTGTCPPYRRQKTVD